MPLTPEQQREGLTKLCAMKKATGILLNAIRCGADPIEPIENMDYIAYRIPLSTYLRAVPGIGPITAKRILSVLGCEPRKKMKGMSQAKRDVLISLIRRYWKPGWARGGKDEGTDQNTT